MQFPMDLLFIAELSLVVCPRDNELEWIEDLTSAHPANDLSEPELIYKQRFDEYLQEFGFTLEDAAYCMKDMYDTNNFTSGDTCTN